MFKTKRFFLIKFIMTFFIAFLLPITCVAAKTKANPEKSKTIIPTTANNPHPYLEPITWKGPKWEYYLEFPKDIKHISVIRMQELMDDMGQHGWELVTITHENNFYGFFFKRPLHEHKVKVHRDRVNKWKGERLSKRAAQMEKIRKVHAEKVAFINEREQLNSLIAKEQRMIAEDKAKEARLIKQGAAPEKIQKIKQEEVAIEGLEAQQEEELSILQRLIKKFSAKEKKLVAEVEAK
jgi:hypothetical protein